MDKNKRIIRNYRSTDFDQYVQLRNETIQRDRPDDYISKELLAEALGHPSFSPEDDLFVAEKSFDPQLIGYVSVFREPGIGRSLLDGSVHPLNRRMGVGTELFEHAVEYSRVAGLRKVQVCVSETNLPAIRMLSGLGLKFFRHFWGYRLDLAEYQVPEVKTGQFTFRSLEPDEVVDLTAIQNRSFADTWGFNANTNEEIFYRINSMSSRPENVIMVYQGRRPVAYCWTRIHPSDTAADRKGEIHMLGVDPDFRGQSIGRKVLIAGLSYLKLKKVGVVELMADSEMPAAMALYESAGFRKYLRMKWYEMKL